VGNFLFRTANYRQAQSQRKATEETNRLLREQIELQRQAAAQPVRGGDGRYYSADGRYVWDGAAWQPRIG
jgi:hypothetical protein